MLREQMMPTRLFYQVLAGVWNMLCKNRNTLRQRRHYVREKMPESPYATCSRSASRGISSGERLVRIIFSKRAGCPRNVM